MSKKREDFSLLKSFIALLLVILCLWAAQWQFNRGLDRQARNSAIEENTSRKVKALKSLTSDVKAHEWQSATISGTFDTSQQILLRNRYFEGVYGFQLLTRFETSDGKSFWVDCGWLKAGPNALTPPDIPDLPRETVTIEGRLRLDSSLPRGAFFALPSDGSQGLISQANAQSRSQVSEKFYIDLLKGDRPELTPAVPAQLPELSDGPHMAYAVQWVFFGGLVVYGRILIRRDVLSRKKL
ncbi:MAG: SURF1 family protein [Candidatus Planktophila sp.]